MKIKRRTLMIAGGVLGGGLVVGAAGVGGYVSTFSRRDIQRGGWSDGEGRLLAAWIVLHADGRVRVLSPHTEMGQGAQTGLLQIVLEELDADPSKTTVELAPTTPQFANSDNFAGLVMGDSDLTGWSKDFMEKTFGRGAQFMGLQITGGSTSIRFTGWKGMRRAAAAARQMLAEAGAEKLGVPVADVTTADGEVIHASSGKRVGYGELAEAAAARSLPESPAFKDAASWKYIGKPFPRVDIPDKVFAKAVYGIDVEVPEMRYAAVAPPPVALATVTGVENEAELTPRRGVEAVIVMRDAVAVVANNPWRAEQAARAAKVTYEPPEGGAVDSAQLLEKQRATIEAGELESVHSVGDAAGALASGEVIEAEYLAPFLAHAPMEPLNATVWTDGAQVHVASGVQAPLNARAAVAKFMDRDLEDVVFHTHTMGGGFGRRGGTSDANNNWLRQAVDIHEAVGGAVKLTWSREADVQLCSFRPADVARMRAVLGPDGKPTAWHAQTYAKIGSVHEATPRYTIPNVAIDTAAAEPALPFAYWRSVDASTHGFFIESFIDELARAAQQDPIDYRLSLLPEGRHARVIRRVAEMSGWGKPGPEGTAKGVAMFECFGSIVAQVAEVSHEDDIPRVHRVWCVADCGVAINPNAVEAQMQGGIVYGLSAALYGAITAKEGRIEQSNFHDYRVIRFSDGPRIDVDILTSLDAPVGGAGEPGTPPIAPAVGNAMAALGGRPRALPFA